MLVPRQSLGYDAGKKTRSQAPHLAVSIVSAEAPFVEATIWPRRLPSMERTPASLLEQVRDTADETAWKRFVQLYTPLLYHWGRRLGLKAPDAADLVQDVFAVLVLKLPEFRYDPQRSFRAWLRTVALNKWRDNGRRRLVSPLEENNGGLPEPAGPDGARDFEKAEYHKYLSIHALRVMQAEFRPTTWKACWEHVVVGRPAAEVAAELGVTVNAVYLAKSHVLSRLRQEMAGLLD
jgi:RNA polymerase sigma-70 factor, ECF subfamily